uniref:Uncharacterized protein n=1 Tax=Glossina pallidipes TaxID=7398 RepID=A0A1A9Z7S0_GLOPL
MDSSLINSIELIPRDEISVPPYSEMKLSTTEKKLFKYCETSIRVFVINSDAIPAEEYLNFHPQKSMNILRWQMRKQITFGSIEIIYRSLDCKCRFRLRKSSLHAVMDSTDGRMVRAPRRKRNEEQMCDRWVGIVCSPWSEHA